MTSIERWILVLSVLVGLFVVWGFVQLSLGEVRYDGEGWTAIFPDTPRVETGAIPTTCGPITYTDASYQRERLFFHIRYATIPEQYLVVYTPRDVVIKMLEPLSEASKVSIAHMTIRQLIKEDRGGLWAVEWNQDDNRFFAATIIEDFRAYTMTVVAEKKDFPLAFRFLDSLKIKREKTKKASF